jgi:putative transposase
MVFCVTYRKKLLYDLDKIEFLKFICSEIEQRYSVVFDTIGTDEIMFMFLSVQLQILTF